MKKRTDDNQRAIVNALRQAGATVTPTHMVGDGFVDVVVGWMGINFLVEIKDGSKPPSKRKLTPDEQDWHDAWKGESHIVYSVDEALALLRKYT